MFFAFLVYINFKINKFKKLKKNIYMNVVVKLIQFNHELILYH